MARMYRLLEINVCPLSRIGTMDTLRSPRMRIGTCIILPCSIITILPCSIIFLPTLVGSACTCLHLQSSASTPTDENDHSSLFSYGKIWIVVLLEEVGLPLD
jgi:hypothetical protein